MDVEDAVIPGTTLARLPVGGSGRVLAVDGDRDLRRRLMELGVTPGATLRLVGVAPLGDPLEVEVRSCRLSLRRDQAAAVRLG